MPKSGQPMEQEFLMLADHPALDFLNTEVRINGELVDLLQSDDDVLRWFARAGWPVDKASLNLYPELLLDIARGLRAAIHGAIEKYKAGESDNGIMNMFLFEAKSYLKLVPDNQGGLRLERRWEPKTPEQVLGPLMESAAELLAANDLKMIKRCEDAECILWFYDRTRAHRRRWCNMATCGTRNKVAAFRQRG
ncbi:MULTISPECIES: ABATE domain-containing protein [Acidobacteriaceae]|uniref:CGNR zinc finger domain-containing protein n=1 Tax=Acidobacteriaceae TaxID=204434 RepID=UPI00131B7A2D|nr:MULTISPECIES: ABATE domain-containing protein [Acidobacteriaceae]MDW5264566.1 ABATE domain-containing protein [Edaphobacter sp.]